MVHSIAMKIRIYSNEMEAHLTPFIGNFLANVCVAIVSSLKTPKPIRTLRYDIEGESVCIELNGQSVPLNLSQGFSRVIILDTIRGMLRHLKLADPNGAIRIEIDTEAE